MYFNVYFCENVPAMATTKNDMQTDYQSEVDVLTDHEDPCNLIVWNDEVNTFEWVIETLMEVCGHSPEQAEQCSYFIHHKGKEHSITSTLSCSTFFFSSSSSSSLQHHGSYGK
jgi:ATP-dependent Clp protease adapter protein ClpS